MQACSEGAKGVPGGGRRVNHPFGPASIGAGGGEGLLPCFLLPKREPAHGLHPCFAVAEIWADRDPGGGGGGLKILGAWVPPPPLGTLGAVAVGSSCCGFGVNGLLCHVYTRCFACD